LCFSSGMTAIAVLILAACNAGDVIVHSGPLYAASEGFVAKVMAKYGVTYVAFPAGASPEKLDEVMREAKAKAQEQGGEVPLIYLESPGNPTNALVDIEAVKEARDAHFDPERCPIAIDNTFLGPLWQRPLEHGADLVVYSLTKYVGGHSDLVAGSVAGGKKWIDAIRALRNTMGGIADPNTAWMLLRSLETVELRMQRAGENAAKVCAMLKKHPKVEGLGYLGMIEDARQQDIYDRHCLGAGSTFSVFIKGGEAECFRFLDALKVAKLAVSLGGTETLASHPASMTHLSVPEGRRAELGISDNLVRISIGIEDADDLIADFEQALEAV
jgi:methionine-gamma-lyase